MDARVDIGLAADLTIGIGLRAGLSVGNTAAAGSQLLISASVGLGVLAGDRLVPCRRIGEFIGAVFIPTRCTIPIRALVEAPFVGDERWVFRQASKAGRGGGGGPVGRGFADRYVIASALLLTRDQAPGIALEGLLPNHFADAPRTVHIKGIAAADGGVGNA